MPISSSAPAVCLTLSVSDEQSGVASFHTRVASYALKRRLTHGITTSCREIIPYTRDTFHLEN